MAGNECTECTNEYRTSLASAIYHGRLSRSEFHDGQVPLKASGSCSWCWYSSRHIQRVVNIFLQQARLPSATMLHAQPNRAPRCKAVQAQRGRGMTKMCHGTRERASLRALGTPPATRAVCPPFT